MTKLTVPQLCEIIGLHHPNVLHTMAAQRLSTAQEKFVRKSKNNVRTSILSMASKTVVGETEASPLSITDTTSTFVWQFFKDATIGTVKMKSSSNAYFYLNIHGVDGSGEAIDKYTVSFNPDGSVLFMDENGDALTDFQGDVDYLYITFVKVPTQLAASAYSTPDIAGEYNEALADYVIAELYMTRQDLEPVARLQFHRHFMNRFDQTVQEAKKAFYANYNQIPLSAQFSGEFEKD